MGWRIEYQIEGIESGGPGGFTKGVTIGWVTDSGIHGTVFVPLDDLTPEVVKERVGSAVAARTAIAGLTHQS
jgi:hypothetical protein